MAVLIGACLYWIAWDARHGLGMSIWAFAVVGIAIYGLPGAFRYLLLLQRVLSSDGRLLWIEGDNLVYVSPMHSSVPLRSITGIELATLRKHFGLQPYLVIKSSSRRSVFLHLDIMAEGMSAVRQRIQDAMLDRGLAT